MTPFAASGRVVGPFVSPAWPGASPRVTVVVSSWNRRRYLVDLVDALGSQEAEAGSYEVVIVDNASSDDTEMTLRRLVDATAIPLAGMRLAENHGPGPARNAAVSVGRGSLVLFTDDDCLPEPGWVRAMVAAFDGADHPTVVQGRVSPDEAEWRSAGPWDHTMFVSSASPFFQTCNIGYRRAAFDAVGGFDASDPLGVGRNGRAFGEDTLLGIAVVEAGGRRSFAPDAVVRHRVVASGLRSQITDRRNASGIPGLAKRSRDFRGGLVHGRFLSTASRNFDLALIGGAVAAVTRSPLPLAAAAPWVRTRLRPARRASGGWPGTLAALGGWALLDAAVALALAEGSIRHRHLVG